MPDDDIIRRSRRGFLRAAGGATVTVALAALIRPRAARAQDLPQLDPQDPQAQALQYVHQSVKEGQACSTCQLWQGGQAAWGPCPLFAGKAVNADGWCASWVQRAA